MTARSAADGLSAKRGYLDGRTRAARRVKELLVSFLPPDCRNTATIAQARRAAELVAATETLRQRLLAGHGDVDLDALIRLEGEARRAVRALSPGTILRENAAAALRRRSPCRSWG